MGTKLIPFTEILIIYFPGSVMINDITSPPLAECNRERLACFAALNISVLFFRMVKPKSMCRCKLSLPLLEKLIRYLVSWPAMIVPGIDVSLTSMLPFCIITSLIFDD